MSLTVKTTGSTTLNIVRRLKSDNVVDGGGGDKELQTTVLTLELGTWFHFSDFSF